MKCFDFKYREEVVKFDINSFIFFSTGIDALREDSSWIREFIYIVQLILGGK